LDASAALDELTDLVSSARAMPMSASCVVNRGEVLAAIEALRAALPDELGAARGVLHDRSAVVADGRSEAEAIVAEALAEQARMVSQAEVVKAAGSEADRLVAAAQADVSRMRREVDDYVDTKLAHFEIVLQKTLAAVGRGREKISGRHDELAALADAGAGELVEPLPG
jgi:regulator of protease activity HflC (stomatin/prohibitin superfamily)